MTFRDTLLFLTALAFAGCQDADNKAAKGKEYTFAGETTLSPDEQKKVVAKVGDRVITLQEFESRLNQQSVFARSRHNSPERKKEFLDSLVRFELLAIEAKRKGYDKDPDVLLAQKQEMVKRFTAKELSQLLKMSDITERELKTYFESHPAEFNRAAQVRAAHIVVADEKTANTVLAAVRTEIQKDPPAARAAFARMVKKYSTDDATKARKGDLGFFGEPGVSSVKRPQNAPRVPSAVAKAAYGLESVGDIIAAPIKTPNGWHIVQKTGYRRALTRTLDEVKNKLRIKLFRKRKGKALENYVKGLYDTAKITINQAVLDNAKAKRPRSPMPPIGPPSTLRGVKR